MLNSINHHKLDQKQTYQVMLTNQESEYFKNQFNQELESSIPIKLFTNCQK